MSVIGVIEADLEVSGIGTRSRLGEDLCGEAVLRRTIRQASRAEELRSLHLVVHASQGTRARGLVGDLPVIVETHDQPPPVWRELAIAGRKWALGGWRGGPGGACVLDEGFHPAVVGALAKREGAAGTACISPAAVVLDPVLLDRMVAHFLAAGERLRITFAQAPPGLAATVWDTEVLIELGGAGHPPGRLLNYQPDDPMHDLVVSDCGYKVTAEVTHTAGRFLADNRRSMETLAQLLGEAGGGVNGLDVETVCRWQRERARSEPWALPCEVELELTTEDQLSTSSLRPRGELVGQRGPMPVEMVEAVLAELAAYDDSLAVLGGFGEPLLHPEFDRVLQACKSNADGTPLLGLAMRTNAIGLNGEVAGRIVDAGVDVVSLMVDATTAETYRAVHGVDMFAQALTGIEALIGARQQGGRGLPVLVPELVKIAETMGDMETFFDDWMRRVGWVNIEPFNDGAGRRRDRAVMRMSPPARWACGRLWSRCLVLADGRVVRCDQDYTGAEPVGTLRESSLAEIWRGSRLDDLRGLHRSGRWSEAGMCASCQHWHRP